MTDEVSVDIPSMSISVSNIPSSWVSGSPEPPYSSKKYCFGRVQLRSVSVGLHFPTNTGCPSTSMIISSMAFGVLPNSQKSDSIVLLVFVAGSTSCLIPPSSLVPVSLESTDRNLSTDTLSSMGSPSICSKSQRVRFM